MKSVLKFIAFAIEAAIVAYAAWLIFKDNPTIKDLTWLCSMTLIQSLINEGKINDIRDKLTK